MRHWTYWEWLAYVCLFVSAVIIAADTGIRVSSNLSASLPNFFHGPIWGFAPLILVLIATGILVIREYRTPVAVSRGNPTTLAVAIPKGLKWLSGYDILELADAALLEKRAVAKADLEQVRAEFDELHARFRATTAPEEIRKIEAERDKLADVHKQRERKSEALWAECWEDIRKQLAQGGLLAKGFLRPLSQNPNELLIPSEYWRFLKFSDAYTNARGEDKFYTGVQVARRAS